MPVGRYVYNMEPPAKENVQIYTPVEQLVYDAIAGIYIVLFTYICGIGCIHTTCTWLFFVTFTFTTGNLDSHFNSYKSCW